MWEHTKKSADLIPSMECQDVKPDPSAFSFILHIQLFQLKNPTP